MPNAQSVGERVLSSETLVTNIADELPSEAQRNERTGGLPRTYEAFVRNIADDRVTNIRVDFRAKHRVYNEY